MRKRTFTARLGACNRPRRHGNRRRCHFNSHLRFVFRERLWCNRANYVCKVATAVNADQCVWSLFFPKQQRLLQERQKLICYLDHNGLKTANDATFFFCFSHPNQVSSPTKSFQESFRFQLKDYYFFLVLVFMA